ncbi:MAG: carbohydrate kinase family protein [Candidatus Bathyarchaeaceae archaeon]
MAHRLVFVGHVSVDKVENVHGTRVQPGGAALYAAVAARTLSTNVTLVSAVGRDYQFPETLKKIGDSHVKVYDMPSTSFHIRYNDRWEARYLKTSWGASPKVSSVSVLVKGLEPNAIIHISPMKPAKVTKILKEITNASAKAKVSINTWIDYLKESRKNRGILKRLASMADFFILNDSEAKVLAQTDSISTALRLLDAKMLVVTLGQLGAIISEKNKGMQMVPALSIPVEKVVDTTGAGDAWCGAFLATYDLTEDLMKSISVASIISSIKCSGWGFENLINLRFKKPDDVIEYVIGLKEGSFQKSLIDYTSGY